MNIRRSYGVSDELTAQLSVYISDQRRIYRAVGKHLVDIDEQALHAARAELGTKTIKETVNRALERAGSERATALARRLDTLADAELVPREQAWR
jgi:Arc/MetJ family transcription regulator